MTINQIITDWRFWSFLVAITALVLSQLPPVHVLVRRAKLDLEIYSRIFITHKIGNPNLQIHLILRNIGGRTLRVKNINTNIFRDGEKIINLPAETYIADPKDNLRVLLTNFDIKPDEEWSNMTSFLRYFDRKEEKEYNTAKFKLMSEINQLRKKLPNTELAIASEEFVLPFNKLFDEKFIWLPGDYVLELNIETDNPKANSTKKYRFTIFESLTEDLKNHKAGFASGAGVYFDSPDYSGTWIDIEEKNG